MKITIYTIKDCAFSKQEKDYLNTNKLVFEEKDLETNKDFLTEMLAISNNFAGTPVTRVEKDDGTIAVLKGFTKEEFDTTLGLAVALTPTDAGLGNPTPTTVPTDSTGSTDSTDSTASSTPAPTPVEPPMTQPTETPASPDVQTPNLGVSTNDPLKSVMDNLQSQTAAPTAPPAVGQPPVVETPASPPIRPVSTDSTDSTAPSVPPADAPSIPDFPAK